jgi:hypothetical protein
MVLGSGGGFLKTGRRIVYRRETPICNLYLTMMEGMGVHKETSATPPGICRGLTA